MSRDTFRMTAAGIAILAFMIAPAYAPISTPGWEASRCRRWSAPSPAAGVVDLAKRAVARPLPKSSYRGMLRQLRGWIETLRPPGADKTVWGDYANNNSYATVEAKAKERAIEEFASGLGPNQLWDLGCNTGAYSQVALDNGARADERKLNFLPLYQDASNPSPGQGWGGAERKSLKARAASADAFLVAVAILIPAILFAIGGAARLIALAFPVFVFAFFNFMGFFTIAELLGLQRATAVLGGVAGLIPIIAATADVSRRRDQLGAATLVLVVIASIAAGSSAFWSRLSDFRRSPGSRPTADRPNAPSAKDCKASSSGSWKSASAQVARPSFSRI